MTASSAAFGARAPLFTDRVEAGGVLAEALRRVLPNDAVVVGLARGGVVVAAEVARALGLELDVVAVRKIGAPWQPEYALGAVAPEDGVVIRDRAGLDDAALERLVEAARSAAEALDRELHGEHPPAQLGGRVCALVDDGLATGATMVAALRWARSRGAARTVAAVPVGARGSLAALGGEADDVICPFAPEDFFALGYWYEHFGQVESSEVRRLLAEARVPR
jgi:putative phosphoribosyl transferase